MDQPKINLADVPVQHQQWGKGRYDRKRRHVSVALGNGDGTILILPLVQIAGICRD